MSRGVPVIYNDQPWVKAAKEITDYIKDRKNSDEDVRKAIAKYLNQYSHEDHIKLNAKHKDFEKVVWNEINDSFSLLNSESYFGIFEESRKRLVWNLLPLQFQDGRESFFALLLSDLADVDNEHSESYKNDLFKFIAERKENIDYPSYSERVNYKTSPVIFALTTKKPEIASDLMKIGLKFDKNELTGFLEHLHKNKGIIVGVTGVIRRLEKSFGVTLDSRNYGDIADQIKLKLDKLSRSSEKEANSISENPDSKNVNPSSQKKDKIDDDSFNNEDKKNSISNAVDANRIFDESGMIEKYDGSINATGKEKIKYDENTSLRDVTYNLFKIYDTNSNEEEGKTPEFKIQKIDVILNQSSESSAINLNIKKASPEDEKKGIFAIIESENGKDRFELKEINPVKKGGFLSAFKSMFSGEKDKDKAKEILFERTSGTPFEAKSEGDILSKVKNEFRKILDNRHMLEKMSEKLGEFDNTSDAYPEKVALIKCITNLKLIENPDHGDLSIEEPASLDDEPASLYEYDMNWWGLKFTYDDKEYLIGINAFAAKSDKSNNSFSICIKDEDSGFWRKIRSKDEKNIGNDNIYDVAAKRLSINFDIYEAYKGALLNSKENKINKPDSRNSEDYLEKGNNDKINESNNLNPKSLVANSNFSLEDTKNNGSDSIHEETKDKDEINDSSRDEKLTLKSKVNKGSESNFPPEDDNSEKENNNNDDLDPNKNPVSNSEENKSNKADSNPKNEEGGEDNNPKGFLNKNNITKEQSEQLKKDLSKGFEVPEDKVIEHVAKQLMTEIKIDPDAKSKFVGLRSIIQKDDVEAKLQKIKDVKNSTNDSALLVFSKIAERLINAGDSELKALDKLVDGFQFLANNNRDTFDTAQAILEGVSEIRDEISDKNLFDDIGEAFENSFSAEVNNELEPEIEKEDQSEIKSEISADENTDEVVIEDNQILEQENEAQEIKSEISIDEIKVEVDQTTEDNQKLEKENESQEQKPNDNNKVADELKQKQQTEAEEIKNQKQQQEIKEEEEKNKKRQEEKKEPTEKKDDLKKLQTEEVKKPAKKESLWKRLKDGSYDVATNKIPRAAGAVILADFTALAISGALGGPVGLAVAYLFWKITEKEPKAKEKTANQLIDVNKAAEEYKKEREKIRQEYKNPPSTNAGKAAAKIDFETEQKLEEEKVALKNLKNALSGAGVGSLEDDKKENKPSAVNNLKTNTAKNPVAAR